MGGKSRSSTSSQQTTTNIQDIDTTTFGLEDSDAIIGGGDVSVTQISTDQGAVEAGREIGRYAFDFAESFGGEAFGTVKEGISDALDFGGTTVRQALDASRQQSAQTATALSGAIERAAAGTRSDTSQGLQKIVLYLTIAGVVVGVVAVFAKRG